MADKRSQSTQEQVTALRDSVGTAFEVADVVRNLAGAEELYELALAEKASLLRRAMAAERDAETHRRRGTDLADQVDTLVDRVLERRASSPNACVLRPCDLVGEASPSSC